MSGENKYLKGSGKEKVFDNGGKSIDITIQEDDFQAIPTFTSKAGVVYRTLRVAERREQDDYGNTHNISVYYKDGIPSGSAVVKTQVDKADDFFGDKK